MHAADQIGSLDASVDEQRAAVSATTGQHAVLITETYGDEVDTVDEGRCRHAVSERLPIGHLDGIDEFDRTCGRARDGEAGSLLHAYIVSSSGAPVSHIVRGGARRLATGGILTVERGQHFVELRLLGAQLQ